jgi:hypothetical protein
MHTATHVCYQNQGEKNKQTSKRRKKSPKTKIAHKFEERRSPTKLWQKCPTQNPNIGISIDDGSCYAETDVNGSWREAAGSAAERRVTDRQRGLSEFIYKIGTYLPLGRIIFAALQL